MLVGPAASAAEREAFRGRIVAQPEKYIAQPTLVAVDLPDLRRRRARAAPHRSAALRAVRASREPRAGRPHARRAARRLAGREFVAGRRHQGHLGDGRLRGPLTATDTHALPHRQRSVLDGPPHRARREHGAPARRHLPHVAAALRAIEPGLAWARAWAVPLITSGLATAFYERFTDLSAENVLRFMILDSGNAVVDLLLPARGARVCARGARRDHLGDVRGPQLDLARDAQLRLRAHRGQRHLRIPRLGEDALASVPRRHLRHHAARRGLPLHPARHAHRACRQHRAHPRRQVPHPAALRGRRRRRGRLLPVGRAAALGVGVRVVSQDLQRRHHAAARGGTADPARGHAALAAFAA